MDRWSIALYGNTPEIAIHDEVKEARRVTFDDRVRTLDGSLAHLSVCKRRYLVTDPELDPRSCRMRWEGHLHGPGEPSRLEVRVPRRGAQRTCAPVRQHVHHRAELQSVLRELVDVRRGRWGEAPARHDSVTLELFETRGEDVRAAANEAGVKIGVPKLPVLEKLPYDQERPALAYDVECVRDRAVLVVALHTAPDCTPGSFGMEEVACILKVNAVVSQPS
jgi:hypothetical protein